MPRKRCGNCKFFLRHGPDGPQFMPWPRFMGHCYEKILAGLVDQTCPEIVHANDGACCCYSPGPGSVPGRH